MDQEKNGKFIAQCRKEKGLTQAQVAERFGISNRAVSKWETGKSCPDASIMIELCDLLGINVYELLSGERICMENYQNKAEKNIAELQKRLQSYKRRIILNNVFLLFVAVISAFQFPLALIAIVIIAAFRDYFLFKNMNSVNKLIKEANF